MNHILAQLSNNKRTLPVILILSFTIPFLLATLNVRAGTMAFWYDPARDLFQALGNMSKPTLIGPPSGIPGLFYGPYWIWLLSSGMLVSKDPRVITFITATLPYFVLFPFVFFQFRRIFSTSILTLLWLLFILGYPAYATQLWNPYPAPLLCLLGLYLVMTTDITKRQSSTYILSLATGIIAGLMVNFHISFGLGFTGGIMLYLLFASYMMIQESKRLSYQILHCFLLMFGFGLGFIATFIPFFVFEYRHGYQQITTVVHTLTSSWAVVGLKGMKKYEIMLSFFGRLNTVVKMNSFVMAILGLGIFVSTFTYLRKTKMNFSSSETRLLVSIITISSSLLYLYLSSKNPVWDYHFIGVEVLFLFLLAFLMKRSEFFTKCMMILVGVLVVSALGSYVLGMNGRSEKLSSLATKEKVVDTVMRDASNASYTIYAYNPAIYNYDYAYLFTAKGKTVPSDPALTPQAEKIYLIIPQTTNMAFKDYIKYRTPLKEYRTVKTWKFPDGTTVIRREHK